MKYVQPNTLRMVVSSLSYVMIPVVMFSVVVEVFGYDYYPLFLISSAPFWISLLILPLYVFLFRHGWFSVLLSVKAFIVLNSLFVLFSTGYMMLEFYIFNSANIPIDPDGYLTRQIVFFCLPLLLILSALSFIFYGKRVGNRWMFTLAILESLFIATIPFIWIPMILYYPIMKKLTLRYRLKLLREKRIKKTSNQYLQEYNQVIPYFFGFAFIHFLLISFL